MILAEWYTGFGFSIEANNTNMYAVPYEEQPENSDEEPELGLLQFDGTIINLPFIKIHIGDFVHIE
jgi:hypothetical protein